MTQRVFVVDVRGSFMVTFDDSLMPDDEWRETFYEINTLEELAEHFAWAVGIQQFSGGSLDGFCNTPLAEDIKVLDDGDWELTARELTNGPK